MKAIARGAAVAFVLALVAACSSNNPTCDCVDPVITLNIPASVASTITSVTLGGTACTGVAAVCTTNGAAGCLQYNFFAAAAGTCNVQVDSTTGVFNAVATINQTTGCCGGFYASPESAATINFPEADGGGG
jgi:hypothetical protein